jgi:hypothetical protein
MTDDTKATIFETRTECVRASVTDPRAMFEAVVGDDMRYGLAVSETAFLRELSKALEVRKVDRHERQRLVNDDYRELQKANGQ